MISESYCCLSIETLAKYLIDICLNIVHGKAISVFKNTVFNLFFLFYATILTFFKLCSPRFAKLRSFCKS